MVVNDTVDACKLYVILVFLCGNDVGFLYYFCYFILKRSYENDVIVCTTLYGDIPVGPRFPIGIGDASRASQSELRFAKSELRKEGL
jgi:hypothetical protein